MSEGAKSAAETAKTLTQLPREDAIREIEANPELRDIVLNMADSDFLDPSQTPQGSEQTPPAGPQDQGGAGSGTGAGTEEPDQKITITVNRSLLGTYLRNREDDPVKALMEFRRGMEEKDRYFDYVKNDLIPAKDQELEATRLELQSTRKQLEDLSKKAAGETEATGGEDDDVLPDDYDPLDPDHQKKLVSGIKRLRQTIAELKAAVNTVHPSGSGNYDPALELTRIRALTRDPQYAHYFGGMQREAREIENDYLAFVRDVAVLGGFSGDIVNASGRIATPVVEMLRAWNDPQNQSGEKLRTETTARGIRPPDDYHYLENIYRIKEIRRRYQVNGQPVDWDEAAKIFAAHNPIQPASQSQELEAHNRYQKALDNRQGFAREPKANEGADLSDIKNMPPQEINRLLNKPIRSLSPDERERTKRIYVEIGRMSDEEAEAALRI